MNRDQGILGKIQQTHPKEGPKERGSWIFQIYICINWKMLPCSIANSEDSLMSLKDIFLYIF